MKEKITLAQGAGGEYMDAFIKDYILTHFKQNKTIEVPLTMLDDAAVVDDVVFTTDSHTVQPLIFPGGDIGSLAVAGTINDLSVLGAQPRALSAGFIIEEGLPITTFETIVKNMGATAHKAGVPIVTGDTKVVEHGALQQLMINTSGIGKRSKELDHNMKEVKRYRKHTTRWLLDSNIKKGDVLIATGTLGDHGIALLSFREGYGFDTKIHSDVAPVNHLMQTILKTGGVVTAKDPTRGGLANTVNEFSEKSHIGILIQEDQIPIHPGVRSACNLLGIDPLEIGNEGKIILGVVKQQAEAVLNTIKKHPLGKHAAIIGEATDTIHGVAIQTNVGGRRTLHKPLGDPVPRIC